MKRTVRSLIVLVALMGGALRAQNITGTWQGTLKAETNQRIVLKIFNEDQRLKGSMYNSAQGALVMRVTSITVQGRSVKFSILSGSGSFEGNLSADGSSIAGTWTQGTGTFPLVLAHVFKKTPWKIPSPPTAKTPGDK